MAQLVLTDDKYRMSDLYPDTYETMTEVPDTLDTSGLTTMANMFNGCKSLTSIDLSGFDTSKVTNMSGMFYGCNALTTLDVSKFNTSKVTVMSNMFAGCIALSKLDLTGFDTSNVTTMSGMFNGCNALATLDLSKFNTAKVNDMGSMFVNCVGLSILDVSNFDTSKVTNTAGMFYGCSNLIVNIIREEDTDTSNISKFSNLFESLDLYESNLSKVDFKIAADVISDKDQLCALLYSGMSDALKAKINLSDTIPKDEDGWVQYMIDNGNTDTVENLHLQWRNANLEGWSSYSLEEQHARYRIDYVKLYKGLTVDQAVKMYRRSNLKPKDIMCSDTVFVNVFAMVEMPAEETNK